MGQNWLLSLDNCHQYQLNINSYHYQTLKDNNNGNQNNWSYNEHIHIYLFLYSKLCFFFGSFIDHYYNIEHCFAVRSFLCMFVCKIYDFNMHLICLLWICIYMQYAVWKNIVKMFSHFHVSFSFYFVLFLWCFCPVFQWTLCFLLTRLSLKFCTFWNLCYSEKNIHAFILKCTALFLCLRAFSGVFQIGVFCFLR